jgi:hypothetical protein
MRQQLQMLKYDLLASKKREEAVSKELELLRDDENARKKGNIDNDNLTTQLVVKHGAKVKASVITPKRSQKQQQEQGSNKVEQNKKKGNTTHLLPVVIPMGRIRRNPNFRQTIPMGKILMA